MPIPTFIYRRHLKQKNFVAFKQRYQKQGSILFNTLRPDKWLVHQQFMKVASLNRYLAKTEQWTHESQLEKWLKNQSKFV